MNEPKVPENRAYKVTLILLLGLAGFSTAMKELNSLHEMVGTVHEFTQQWRGTDLATLNETPVSTQQTIATQETIAITESCPDEMSNSYAESDWSASIVPPRGFETKTSDSGILTEPDCSAKVEMIGARRVNRNVPQLARAKFPPVKHPNQEIAALRRDGNGRARFEYKTLDRTVTVELPLTMVTGIKADAFENEVPPEFLVDLLGKIDRKQSHGKTEARRRELLFKRLERSIGSRRAS